MTTGLEQVVTVDFDSILNANPDSVVISTGEIDISNTDFLADDLGFAEGLERITIDSLPYWLSKALCSWLLSSPICIIYFLLVYFLKVTFHLILCNIL
jgi:hypothetical protein